MLWAKNRASYLTRVADLSYELKEFVDVNQLKGCGFHCEYIDGWLNAVTSAKTDSFPRKKSKLETAVFHNRPLSVASEISQSIPSSSAELATCICSENV